MAKKSEPYRPLGSMVPVLQLKLVRMQRPRFAGAKLGNASSYKKQVMQEKKRGVVLMKPEDVKGCLNATQKRMVAKKISSVSDSGKHEYEWVDADKRQEQEQEEEDNDKDKITGLNMPTPRAA